MFGRGQGVKGQAVVCRWRSVCCFYLLYCESERLDERLQLWTPPCCAKGLWAFPNSSSAAALTFLQWNIYSSIIPLPAPPPPSLTSTIHHAETSRHVLVTCAPSRHRQYAQKLPSLSEVLERLPVDKYVGRHRECCEFPRQVPLIRFGEELFLTASLR